MERFSLYPDKMTMQMKEYLAELAKKKSYADFLESLKENESFTQWGMGVLPAYSPAPYTCELQGSKPGRFLKKKSSPGKNRQCYFMDKAGSIICEVRYEKFLSRENQWLVYKTFFEQREEEIIEYVFDSALEDSCVAKINAIHLTQKKDGHTASKKSLYWNEKYVETSYQSLHDDLLIIIEKIWDGLYAERKYVVLQNNEELVITDITGHPAIQVYPEISRDT